MPSKKVKPSPKSQPYANVLIGLTVLAICLYYFWIMVPLRMLPQNHYYNDLSDAFRAGQVSLLEKPRPELLALADPYDPKQNGPYRLHDASLYKGKYYLYFGPVPALVLFLPLDALFHIKIPHEAATALFLSLGLAMSTLLLKFLFDKINPPAPLWMLIGGILSLGLCNMGPAILLRPDVYEVAISCGYFFAMTALYLLLVGIFSERISLVRLTIASACAGLAIGARPSYILFAIFLPLCCAILAFHHRVHWKSPRFFAACSSLLVPFGVIVLGLLAYNYFRFDNPFEFGVKLQLAAIHPREYPMFQPDQYFFRLYTYLFYAFHVDNVFPFVFLPRGTIFGEPMLGTFWLNPIVILSVVWIAYLLLKKQPKSNFPPGIYFILFGFPISMLLWLSLIAHPLVRYHVDYEGALLVSSLFAWFYFATAESISPPLRKLVRYGGGTLIAYGCWIGISVAINDVAPSAVRTFNEARVLQQKERFVESGIKYKEAVRIAPNFALAQDQLALVYAIQGRGSESVAAFTTAMFEFVKLNRANPNRGYMGGFQGLIIVNPLGDYCFLASNLLQRGQEDHALLALDGMLKAFSDGGYSKETLTLAESVRRIADSSGQKSFAEKVEKLSATYRHLNSQESNPEHH